MKGRVCEEGVKWRGWRRGIRVAFIMTCVILEYSC